MRVELCGDVSKGEDSPLKIFPCGKLVLKVVEYKDEVVPCYSEES